LTATFLKCAQARSSLLHTLHSRAVGAQLSPFPPSQIQLDEECRERDREEQQRAKADAMMAELVEQERREKEGGEANGQPIQRRRNRRMSDPAISVPPAETPGPSPETCNDQSADVVTAMSQWPRAPSLPCNMDHFLCPITTEVMKDPVITVCEPEQKNNTTSRLTACHRQEAGFTYERSAIETWLQTSCLDPTTGIELKTKKLLSNHVLRTIISDMGILE
jgi:hypothetical protein